jgi:hypothetical protein
MITIFIVSRLKTLNAMLIDRTMVVGRKPAVAS